MSQKFLSFGMITVFSKDHSCESKSESPSECDDDGDGYEPEKYSNSKPRWKYPTEPDVSTECDDEKNIEQHYFGLNREFIISQFLDIFLYLYHVSSQMLYLFSWEDQIREMRVFPPVSFF